MIDRATNRRTSQ